MTLTKGSEKYNHQHAMYNSPNFPSEI